MLIWPHLKTLKRILQPRSKDISSWANSSSISSSSIWNSSNDSADPLMLLCPTLMKELTWSWSNHISQTSSNNGSNAQEWLIYRVASPTNDQSTSSSLIALSIMAIMKKVSSNSFNNKLQHKFKFQIWHRQQANLTRQGYKLLWKTTNSTTLVHRRNLPPKYLNTIKLHKVCVTALPSDPKSWLFTKINKVSSK